MCLINLGDVEVRYGGNFDSAPEFLPPWEPPTHVGTLLENFVIFILVGEMFNQDVN